MLHRHHVDFKGRVFLSAPQTFGGRVVFEAKLTCKNKHGVLEVHMHVQQRGACGSQRAVCVFRARSMTEQQEQGEDAGLLSTRELDSSKDDTQGHFRQTSLTHISATLAVFPCSFFHPCTICILCTAMGYSPRRFIFTALILCFYFGCIWSQTIVKRTCTYENKQSTIRDLQRRSLFPWMSGDNKEVTGILF